MFPNDEKLLSAATDDPPDGKRFLRYAAEKHHAGAALNLLSVCRSYWRDAGCEANRFQKARRRSAAKCYVKYRSRATLPL